MKCHKLSYVVWSVVIMASALTGRGDNITHGNTTININFVTVGNPSNPADTAGVPNPCGSVGYVYSIGKYEVTADQWAAVIAADPNVGNAGWWNGSQYVNWSGSQPTASTSWYEATKFCNWLTTGHYNQGYYTIDGDGNAAPNALSHADYAALYGTTYFIPIEDERYKAAYYDPNKPEGAGYWAFPTGSDSIPTAVSSGTAPGTAVFDNPSSSAPASVDHAGGLSPYGTMGQGGNVWEWCESGIPPIGSWGGCRGECWYGGWFGLYSGCRGNLGAPATEWNVIGFRVAVAEPEPSSLALLCVGGIGLFGYAWRRQKPTAQKNRFSN